MTGCILRDGVDLHITGDTCQLWGRVLDGLTWRHWEADDDCQFVPRVDMCAPRPLPAVCDFPWMMGPNKFRCVPVSPSATVADWGLE